MGIALDAVTIVEVTLKLDEKDRGINKVGYSSLAGVLALAHASTVDLGVESLRHLMPPNPLSGGIHFVIAYVAVFVLIAALEMAHAVNVAARERKVDHGLR